MNNDINSDEKNKIKEIYNCFNYAEEVLFDDAYDDIMHDPNINKGHIPVQRFVELDKHLVSDIDNVIEFLSKIKNDGFEYIEKRIFYGEPYYVAVLNEQESDDERYYRLAKEIASKVRESIFDKEDDYHSEHG